MNFIDVLKQRAVQENVNDPYQRIFEEKSKIVTFIQPYNYVIARKKIDLYSKFDYFFFDGIFGAIMVKVFLRLKIKRRSFDMTSIAKDIFLHSIEKGKTFYIVGTEQHLLEKAIENIIAEYPKIRIIGSRNGFFKGDDETNETINQIVALKPDYLVVGMGTPLQDEFLVKVKESGWSGVGFTCGGFIHQASIKLNYYPELLDRFNLRLLTRFMNESYIRKRVLKYFPLFTFLFIKDILIKRE